MAFLGDVFDWATGAVDTATGGNIPGYGGPEIDWSQYSAAGKDEAASRAQQQEMMAMLQKGAAGNAPSVAANQMQQGLQQTQQAAQAQAASARGGALSQSMASRNAMRAGTEAGQQAAAAGATLRAQEQMGYTQALVGQANAQRQMDLARQQAEANKALGVGQLQNQAAGVNLQGETAKMQGVGGLLPGAGALAVMSDATAKTDVRPLVSDVLAKGQVRLNGVRGTMDERGVFTPQETSTARPVIMGTRPKQAAQAAMKEDAARRSEHAEPVALEPQWSDEYLPAWTPGFNMPRAVPVVSPGWHGRHLPSPYRWEDIPTDAQETRTTPPVQVAATRGIGPAARAAFAQPIVQEEIIGPTIEQLESDATAKTQIVPLVSDVQAKTLFAPLAAPDPYAVNRSTVSQWQGAQAREALPFAPGPAPKPDTSLSGAMRASYESAVPVPYEYTAPVADVVKPWATTSLQDAMSGEASKAGIGVEAAWENVKGRLPTDMTPIDTRPEPISQVVAPWMSGAPALPGAASTGQGAEVADMAKRKQLAAFIRQHPIGSDQNMKQGVTPLQSDENAKTSRDPGSPEIRDFLGHLQPYGYEYKPGMGDGPGQRFGVMAQDLKKSDVGSTMVERDPDTGLLAIDVTKGFGPVLAAESDLHKRLSEIERQLKAKRR